MAKLNTTNRPRSDRNAYAGTHAFHSDGADINGSFVVYYWSRGGAFKAGWYWQPTTGQRGTENGPFTSSQAAYRNAQGEE